MSEPEAGKTRITRTAKQARQGVTNHNVRYVLFFGLVGVISAFAIVALFFR